MLILRKLAVCCFLCCVFQYGFTQDKSTSSRIIIETGGNVPFNINSYDKYENGMRYEYWTRLSLSFSDSVTIGDETVVSGATWKLEFKANTSQLFGDYGGNIDLDLITLEVVDAGGNNDLEVFIMPDPISLSENFQPLIEGAPQGNFQILITYTIGEGENNLLGNPPDYYNVDIIFELSKHSD